VAEVVDDFRADPALGRHPLTISTNGALPTVAVDREAFGRALWNLLDNAAKYSEADTPIEVSLGRDADRVLINVHDRGRGIAPEDQKRIFAKFVRGPEAATSGVKGTGVGLALIDHIVRGHGGEVRLVSELGRGSTFTIALPIASPGEGR
jgi:signal transduction histidine kinase